MTQQTNGSENPGIGARAAWLLERMKRPFHDAPGHPSVPPLRTALILTAIAVAALLLRLLALLGNPILPRDGIEYLGFCERWFEEGDAFLDASVRSRPLLFQYLVVALMRCGLSSEAAGVGLNVVAGSLLAVPFLLAGRALFQSEIAGLCAAVLAAVLPPLVEFSISPMRDCLYLFFAIWAWFGVIQALRTGKPLWATLVGAAALFALQCRFEAFELILFGGIGLGVCLGVLRKSWRSGACALLLFLSGAAAAGVFLESLPGYPSVLKAGLERAEYTKNLFHIILHLK